VARACSNLLFVMESELGESSVSGDYGDCLKLGSRKVQTECR